MWRSPRKRSKSRLEIDEDQSTTMASRKKTATIQACPHTMVVLRSTRSLAVGKRQCPICFEEYFDTLPGREQVVTPVKMACQHIFCQSCIKTHRSCEVKCPLPWCDIQFPVQPDKCELCAYWIRTEADSLVLTVRAGEMTSSIDFALHQLAQENDFFELSKAIKRKLIAHVRRTLTRFEWQYHPGSDLAELLDPFLCDVDPENARRVLGPELSSPAPNPSFFPPRDNSPDDYPSGEEPWIAAFFRQWALEYEEENGEVKEGWGAWARKRDADWSWEWPYKRIVKHKIEDGKVLYLVKWLGKRFADSWITKEELGDDEVARAYDKTYGLKHPTRRMSERKKKQFKRNITTRLTTA